MSLRRSATKTSEYRRRKPEDTVLYRLVADHLETFLEHAREAYDGGLPTYVEQELRFPQRFGSSLNLNVHYHVAVPDGVFTRPNPGVRAEFERLSRPSRPDLECLAVRVEMRVTRWLRRRRLLGDEADLFNNEPPESGALDACLAGSLGIGELTSLDGHDTTAHQDEDDRLPEPTKALRRGGHHRGFDVHAGVVVSGRDHAGRERLFRYCARPPLSLERLSTTPEGLVAYRLRKPWSSDQTHRVMTPLEFMARLAALVPPPRHPLVRFHGVFAPHSSWRRSVVPERTATDPPASGSVRTAAALGSDTEQAHAEGESGAPVVAPHTRRPRCVASVVRTPAASDAQDSNPGESRRLRASPTALAAVSSYIDWAELLKRVYDVDALACPCGGRLSFIALITEEETAQAILESMGLPSTPPPLARARSPDLVDPIPPDW